MISQVLSVAFDELRVGSNFLMKKKKDDKLARRELVNRTPVLDR